MREFAKMNLLITGLPGVGKTTLIRKISGELKDFHPVGFYTAEIRDQGIRKGFELMGLDGRNGILAHQDVRTPFRVGRYHVDVKGFEDFLEGISFLKPSSHLIIIDEIGRMECFSERFTTLLKRVLDSEKCVIATIALKGGGIISEIKARKDVQLFELTRRNRNGLLSEILWKMNLKREGYSSGSNRRS
jgi:nucleoside-triphosphatase